ncbi:MAG: hypothetical protein ACYTGC_15615 [Planctomycetota bacterium]|jgi:hypothetical protein
MSRSALIALPVVTVFLATIFSAPILLCLLLVAAAASVALSIETLVTDRDGVADGDEPHRLVDPRLRHPRWLSHGP